MININKRIQNQWCVWSGLYLFSQLINFHEFSDPIKIKVGSLKSDIVKVFMPQKSANATCQHIVSMPLEVLVVNI